MQKTSVPSALLAVTAAAIWGTAFVAQRAGAESVPPLAFLGRRVCRTGPERKGSGRNKAGRKRTLSGGLYSAGKYGMIWPQGLWRRAAISGDGPVFPEIEGNTG